mgnify:CR=1 FL=1
MKQINDIRITEEDIVKLAVPLRAPVEDYITQLELEIGMTVKGRNRFNTKLQKAVKSKKEDETCYGNRLMSSKINVVSDLITKRLEGDTGKAGRGNAITPLLKAVNDSDRLAMLTLKAVLRAITGRSPTSSLCIRIGIYIEDEVRSANLRAQDKQTYKNLLKAVDKKGDYEKKRDTALYIGRVTEHDWNTWTEKTRMNVGIFLLDTLMTAIPDLVEKRLVTKATGASVGRKTEYITATDHTLEWINNNISFMESLQPVYEPLVVPPVQWEEGMVMGGGYVSNHVQPLKLVKVRTQAALESIKYADMPRVLKALNAAQDTAWKIRKPVLELLEHCYVNDMPLGKLKVHAEAELPPKPHDIEENEEARKQWRSQASHIHNENLERAQQKLVVWNMLQTANRYSEFNAIYMPWQLDFRGRVYCVTGLSPQGEDYVKALLGVSKGEALTCENGVKWLFVHVANLFGVDKVSFEERVQWTRDNLADLVKCAEDPLANQMWTDADKPWQAYAACLELQGYVANGYDHVCNMPVALDGSCSGLQNLGMALTCEITGKSVNLIPSDKPSDIYREVADKVNVMLREACGNAETAEGALHVALDKVKVHYFENGTKPSEKKWLTFWNKIQAPKKDNKKNELEDTARKILKEVTQSYAWLQFGITRSECKRSVMTFPYGSKEFGFKEQVMEDTLRPALKKLLDKHSVRTTCELPQGVWHFSDDGFSAAAVLARFLFIAVRATVLKAAEAMEWMQDTARLVASEQRPIRWTTPIGFPVTQDYKKTKLLRVDSVLNGSRYQYYYSENTLELDINKNASSISPNVVHSLDSTHLLMTVAQAKDEGMNDFALIHDSFGVLPNKTERFFMIIREAFKELYSDTDVFQELYDNFSRQLPPEKRLEMKELPIKGNLDRSDILKSLYAFA